MYKAYDIKKMRYVVCKVHHLNHNWPIHVKENFIKHTNRENDVFKLLNHPNIVKYFETINMDDYSFCTVLEYCDGKDLDYKLKQNSYFSEKIAKSFIQKILEVIKYLNEQNPKIIHYDLKP